MPVELRKRPPPKETATPAPTAKRTSSTSNTNSSTAKSLASKAKQALTPKSSGKNGAGGSEPADPVVKAPPTSTSTSNGTAVAATNGSGKITVGQTVKLDGGFGGTVQTHEGREVTLKELLDESLAGVVIFTYPRASTPGCTTQVCLFRDNYTPITGASLSVFGLSTDSPKANTTFATKQKLPYPLLCDPNATLTSALGLKKPGPGKSTARGVVAIDKQSTVRVHELGGPQKTLDVVLEYIKTADSTQTVAPAAEPAATEEAAKSAEPTSTDSLGVEKFNEVPIAKTPTTVEEEAAQTAAEVSETAAKIDGVVERLKA